MAIATGTGIRIETISQRRYHAADCFEKTAERSRAGAIGVCHACNSASSSASVRSYLCSILDGFSRYIVNWDIRESMTEADIEIILQGAMEKYPEARPRIVSDNGSQFIAKDFKDARPHLAVLPSIDRKDRTLAQIAQRGVHPAWHAVIARMMRADWCRVTSSVTTTCG